MTVDGVGIIVLFYNGHKNMYNNAEIVHWMSNKDTHTIIPAHADIDLSNICNQDCFYCNSAEFRKVSPTQKKYQDYIRLIDQLASWRAVRPTSYGTLHSLSFPGGGEPTILSKYEQVIEHALDKRFLVSITTNGSKLEPLIENVAAEKLRKLSWVGIDIDSGNQETYEKIRRSLTKTSLFNRVMNNARSLVDIGVNVDFKVLLNQQNSTHDELESIFAISKDIGVRMVYFRPVVANNSVYKFTEELSTIIANMAEKYQIKYKANKTKDIPRTYKRCHQMFQFPVFAADGNIYLCCENRGNPNFCLGSWYNNDIRDLWLSDRHYEIYNKINTNLCQPCRPNYNNIQIQKIIDDPTLLQELLYV